jgi:OTU-like cysteine protease/Ankyrin repeats (3 copies)
MKTKNYIENGILDKRKKAFNKFFNRKVTVLTHQFIINSIESLLKLIDEVNVNKQAFDQLAQRFQEELTNRIDDLPLWLSDYSESLKEKLPPDIFTQDCYDKILNELEESITKGCKNLTTYAEIMTLNHLDRVVQNLKKIKEEEESAIHAIQDEEVKITTGYNNKLEKQIKDYKCCLTNMIPINPVKGLSDGKIYEKEAADEEKIKCLTEEKFKNEVNAFVKVHKLHGQTYILKKDRALIIDYIMKNELDKLKSFVKYDICLAQGEVKPEKGKLYIKQEENILVYTVIDPFDVVITDRMELKDLKTKIKGCDSYLMYIDNNDNENIKAKVNHLLAQESLQGKNAHMYFMDSSSTLYYLYLDGELQQPEKINQKLEKEGKIQAVIRRLKKQYPDKKDTLLFKLSTENARDITSNTSHTQIKKPFDLEKLRKLLPDILEITSERRHTHCGRRLLREPLDYKDNKCALHFACESDAIGIINFINQMSYGNDLRSVKDDLLHLRTNSHLSPLDLALAAYGNKKKNSDILIHLVQKFSIQANDLTHDITASKEIADKLLYDAVKTGDVRLSEISFALGADININVQVEKDGENVNASLLHLAVECSKKESIAFLLEKKPNLVEKGDKNGDTALHWAVSHDDQSCDQKKEIIKYLLQRHDLSINTANPSDIVEYNKYLSNWKLMQANKPNNVLFIFFPDSKRWKAYLLTKAKNAEIELKEEIIEINSCFEPILRAQLQLYQPSSDISFSSSFSSCLQTELESSTLFGDDFSIMYPKNGEEFNQQKIDAWKRTHPNGILFVFSLNEQLWKAYLIKNFESKEQVTIKIDSLFNEELKKINEENISFYDKSQLRTLLKKETLFENHQFLLSQKFKRLGNPLSKNNCGNTPLHSAILNLNIEKILSPDPEGSNSAFILLINNLKEEFDPYYFRNVLQEKNKDGDTALHLLFKSKALIDQLNSKKLRKTAELPQTDDYRNQLRLFSTLCKPFVENDTSKILNEKKDTFLHLAAKQGLYKVVELTIRHMEIYTLLDTVNCECQTVMSIISQKNMQVYQSFVNLKVDIDDEAKNKKVLAFDKGRRRQNIVEEERDLIKHYGEITQEQRELQSADSVFSLTIQTHKEEVLRRLIELNKLSVKKDQVKEKSKQRDANSVTTLINQKERRQIGLFSKTQLTSTTPSVTALQEGDDNTVSKTGRDLHLMSEENTNFEPRTKVALPDKKPLTFESELSNQKLEDIIKQWNNETAKKLNSDEALKKEALAFGFACINVKKNGNCLFEAILDQMKDIPAIKQKQYEEQNLRNLAIQHFIDHKEHYEEFVENHDFQGFIQMMAETGTWGEHKVLYALSHVLNISIVIINSDGTDPIILRKENPMKTIYLGYEVDIHYQSLHKDNQIIAPQKDIHDYIGKAEFMKEPVSASLIRMRAH